MILEIGVGSPVTDPVGVDQHGHASQVAPREGVGVDGLPVGGADDQAGQGGDAVQSDLAEVLAVGIAMEGRVQIGAGIADHLDPADLEFGPGVVIGPRGLAAQMVANQRRRQALVGDHAGLDGVAEVDQAASWRGHLDILTPPGSSAKAGSGPVCARSRRRSAAGASLD